MIALSCKLSCRVRWVTPLLRGKSLTLVTTLASFSALKTQSILSFQTGEFSLVSLGTFLQTVLNVSFETIIVEVRQVTMEGD